MFSQPSSEGQHEPSSNRHSARKSVRTVLIVLLLVVIVVLLTFAVVLSGRSITKTLPSSPSPTVAATGSAGSLKITLTLLKTVYNLGEPVNLTVTISNISGQTVNFTHTGLDFNFQVYNDTNSLVFQWSNFRAIPQFVAIEPFPAGTSMSQNFTWLQTCNFNASVIGDQISAGTYFIVGQSGLAYKMQTSPTQITIVKP